ncbi:MAG: hypothetical protein AAGF12_22635 [Myxococcota bacterium]
MFSCTRTTGPGRALCLLVVLAPGCISLSSGQSAQTVAPGKVLHSFGAEWYGVGSDERAENLPFVIPNYGVRIGVAEGVDFGIRAAVVLSNVRLDVKLQPLDSEYVDLAIAPTVHYGWGLGWVYVPVLVGLHINPHIEVTITGRVGHTFELLEDTDFRETDVDEVFGFDPQVVAGAGVGIYFRVNHFFGIVPEFQFVQGFGDQNARVLTAAIGLSFGPQPGVEPPRAEEEIDPQDPDDFYGPQDAPGEGPSGPVRRPAGYSLSEPSESGVHP